VSILAEARQRVASGARLIVWDRYVDSARVYRAAEVELGLAPLALLELVETINADFPTPDLTIYLDVDVETAKRRLLEREGKPDPRLPLALAGYRRLAENNENYVVLAARRAKDEVLADVAMLLEGLLS
jgi:thymidylate kinase